jgi:hydrogenase-4 membrane subunit HyfE
VNPVLIAFVGVLVLPLFVASWRLRLIGLALQGLLMGWISYDLDPALDSYGAWLAMIDLVLVRGLVAPFALYTVLRSHRTTARHDLIPPNLMTWSLAIALLIVAFRFADLLVPVEGNEHSFVAGATAGVLLGFLMLATQTGPLSQMMGALRIENGIAMLELGGHSDIAMQIAQTVILIATILLFRWYLKTLPRASTVKVSAVEGSV